MIKLKLEALEHPAPSSVDINDRKVFASTILWLEDQKIRQYKIEDREDLRLVDQLDIWEQAYDNYKTDLCMPQFCTPLEEITWLLGYAIRLEFLDSPENYKAINSIEVSKQQNKSVTPSIKAENFFDNMDFNHKDFIAGIRSMANKLKVPHHPNHLVQLEAIARIVHERLSPSAKNRQAITGTPFPFEKGNDVVVTDDSALDYPVRILRLLQIQSLRQLQTKINEAIVAVQDLTANPKTDTKLGKVGR
ncbi:RNA transcription, translation and transport factor protein [Anastrepha ludens]|uniref:RNA transcription, translation and transport factor protein n=1 Tax=Anastrepha ludens TaxID=28586 RepID=UPI0023AEB862|nr:RNA transcription, translation and transport factor protein [Anastrepha ludens]